MNNYFQTNHGASLQAPSLIEVVRNLTQPNRVLLERLQIQEGEDWQQKIKATSGKAIKEALAGASHVLFAPTFALLTGASPQDLQPEDLEGVLKAIVPSKAVPLLSNKNLLPNPVMSDLVRRTLIPQYPGLAESVDANSRTIQGETDDKNSKSYAASLAQLAPLYGERILVIRQEYLNVEEITTILNGEPLPQNMLITLPTGVSLNHRAGHVFRPKEDPVPQTKTTAVKNEKSAAPPPYANHFLTGDQLRKLYKQGERDFRGAFFYLNAISHMTFDGADFSGAHFSGIAIHRVKFRGANLSGAYFLGTVIGSVDFTGANLSGAHFMGAQLSYLVAAYADLRGAIFAKASVEDSLPTVADAKFNSQTILPDYQQKSRWRHQGAVFDHQISPDIPPRTGLSLDRDALLALYNGGERDFRGTILEGIDLKGEDLSEADFSGATLEKADFSGAELKGAKFVGAFLKRANFEAADLSEADLRGAYLERAKLTKAILSGADLRGADLRQARFIQATLSGADLRGTYVVNSNFKSADLRGADLRLADIGNSRLEEVDLRGADLRGVFLEIFGRGPVIFTGAKISKETRVDHLRDFISRGAVMVTN